MEGASWIKGTPSSCAFGAPAIPRNQPIAELWGTLLRSTRSIILFLSGRIQV